MANDTFFDDIEQEQASAVPSKPIWAMDLDDEKNNEDILRWLNGTLKEIKDNNEQRHRQIRRNLALYKGIQYQDQDRADIRERGQDRTQPVKKIVANHLHDLVTNRVSRLIKYKPAVALLPANDELKDKVCAKATKSMLDHLWYIKRFEGAMVPRFIKEAHITGESYFFVTWDPDSGDLHPDFKKASDKGEKVPLMDETGSQVKDNSGNDVYIDRPVKTGEVSYEIKLTTEVFPEISANWEDVNYLFKQEVMPVERARILYPKKADKIKASDGVQIYDYEKMMTKTAKKEVILYHFYFRKSLAMEKGRWIVFTEKEILSNKPFPYDHYNLPCVRITDQDFPGELHGRSGIENVKALTSTYNNMTNLVLRNQVLCSHPKWMMPAGSAKKESLGNDITIVEYKGPVAPQLVQSSPTSSETFKFMELIKQEFREIYGDPDTSRGQPPAGITSKVALQFLSEQEADRFNESVLKLTEAVVNIAVMTLSVCGTYYDASDQRMIRLLGKNGQWMNVFFDVANLSKAYDVRANNTSALPQSKAARIDLLFALNEKYPERFTADQFLDMLDLAQSDKFIDSATVNVRKAEAENEMLLDEKGKAVEPSIQEDHIHHWKTHVRQSQEWSFQYQTPQFVQDKLTDHIMAHEMMMTEIMAKSPVFAEQVNALPGFPIFFVATPQPIEGGMPPEMEPTPQGAMASAEGGLPPEAQAPVQEPMPPVEMQSPGGEPVLPETMPTQQPGAI